MTWNRCFLLLNGLVLAWNVSDAIAGDIGYRTILRLTVPALCVGFLLVVSLDESR